MDNPGDFSVLGAALSGNRQTAVIFANSTGTIAFWNAGAEALFGFSVSEAAAQRVDLIVPEEHRKRHWLGFHRAIGSAWRGADGWGPVPARHKNGQELQLEVFLTPVQADDETARGVLAIFRRPFPEATP